MIESEILAYFFILMGGIVLFAAVTDWDWYFKQRKAQFFVKTFGRLGARVFYALLGGLIVYIGSISL